MTRKKARFVDMHVMILGLSSIVFDRKLFATASLSHSTNTNEWIEDTITDVVMLCDAWRWLHSTAQQLGVKFRIHASVLPHQAESPHPGSRSTPSETCGVPL